MPTRCTSICFAWCDRNREQNNTGNDIYAEINIQSHFYKTILLIFLPLIYV
jgi:hypothetical protein